MRSRRSGVLLSTIHADPKPAAYQLEPRTANAGMGPCCARCKTPFGHSAIAGVCCHARTKLDDTGERK